MTSLQIQARALGDPTRHRIFRLIADARNGVGVAELTHDLGVNHNAVRQHLTKLIEAGLVQESTAAPVGPGRPPRTYRVDPAADGRWGLTGPYERLSVLLTEVAASGDRPLDVGRRAGVRLTDGPSPDPVPAFVDLMARQGFDPSARRRGRRVDVVLATCPFTSAVLADPSVVCELHLGLAQGAAEGIGGLVVEDLEAKDPRRAQCRLRCRVTDED